MPETPTPAKRQPHESLRLAAALVAFLAAVLLYNVLSQPRGGDIPPPATSDSVAGESVSLEQTTPQGAEITVEIPWRSGITALEATRSAGEIDPDRWVSEWRGAGDMAFLIRLGEFENQGGAGLNWLFSINGARADRGAGAVKLAPGDRVLWEFAPYD